MLDRMKEYFVKAQLNEKKYAPEVQKVLLTRNISVLEGMDSIDDLSFGRLNGSLAQKGFPPNPGNKPEADFATFMEADEAMRKLLKNSPVFATNLANQYEANPAEYRTFMESFASDMYNNPKLAARVVAVAGQPDGASALTAFAKQYRDNPRELIKSLDAPTPTTSSAERAPAPSVQAPGAPLPGRPRGTNPTTSNNADAQRQANLQRIQRMAGAPATASAPAAPPPAPTPVGDTLTEQQGIVMFNEALGVPENAGLAKLIGETETKEGESLRDQVLAVIKANPDRARLFNSPAMVREFEQLLKEGKLEEFRTKLTGQEIKPTDLLGDLRAHLTKEMPWLDKFLAGTERQLGDLMGNVMALMGGGENLAKMCSVEEQFKLMTPDGQQAALAAAQGRLARHQSGEGKYTLAANIGLDQQLVAAAEARDKASAAATKANLEKNKGQPTLDNPSGGVVHVSVVAGPSGQKVAGTPRAYSSMEELIRDKVASVTRPDPRQLSDEERRDMTLAPDTSLPVV